MKKSKYVLLMIAVILTLFACASNNDRNLAESMEETPSEKTPSEKTSSEKTSSEKTSSEKASSEETPATEVPQVPEAGLGESGRGTLQEDGYYYYKIHPDGDMGMIDTAGFYRYKPGQEPERILPFWDENYEMQELIGANDYGIYYTKEKLEPYGVSVYLMEQETGEERLLYQTDNAPYNWAECVLLPDGNLCLDLSAVGDAEEQYEKQQLVIDGSSGERLADPISETEWLMGYECTHLQIGTRSFTTQKCDDGSFDLLENGVSVLPEGTSLVRIPLEERPFLEGIAIYYQDKQTKKEGVLFLLEDGRNVIPEFSASSAYTNEVPTGMQVAGDNIFYYADNYNRYYNLSTQENGRLTMAYQGSQVKCSAFRTDGTYFYCYINNGEKDCQEHSLWKILYEGEKLVGLEFVETIMDQYGNR